uniref:Putative secreted protein n=1 Tax=Anopheles darlingi TaxID=43151 RepID=A0A2M4DEP2_ANODA
MSHISRNCSPLYRLLMLIFFLCISLSLSLSLAVPYQPCRYIVVQFCSEHKDPLLLHLSIMVQPVGRSVARSLARSLTNTDILRSHRPGRGAQMR